MPEGDTVWHTAAVLRDALSGKLLTRCDIRVPRYATVDLTGEMVDEVISRGKHLFIRVGPASIHSHLKMNGSWRLSRKPVGADHRVVADPPRLVSRAREMLWANRSRWSRCTTGDTRPSRQLWVYGRAGLPCRRCGTRIEREPGDRVTYWCPSCQR